MQKRTIFVLALAGLLLLGLFAWRLSVAFYRAFPEDVDTSEGVSWLQKQEQADVAERENALRSLRDQQGATTAAQTTNALTGGNYRAAFRDTVIAGDSLVKALTEYHILDSSQVLAEVSVGPEHLEKMTGTIVSRNPRYLVLHYGENDLDRMERAPYFIREYKQIIGDLQKRLPNTTIYVDSIWPVLDKAHKTEPYTVNIDEYNKLLRKMCQELGVTFLDYDPLFRSFTENYYDPDGIHPKYKFYTEQYLPFLYKEVHRS